MKNNFEKNIIYIKCNMKCFMKRIICMFVNNKELCKILYDGFKRE